MTSHFATPESTSDSRAADIVAPSGVDRRDFLMQLSIIAGGTVIAGCGQGDGTKTDVADLKGVAWSKAPCRYCGTGCGVEVGVKDSKVVAVRGDELSPVNRGLLCAKGYHLPGMLYGEDRLQYPMKRSADGKSFSRISWDEAIALIAEKYREALDKHGPESIAMYGSGQWTVFDGYAAAKWFKGGMKSNNLEANARVCMASAVAGFMTQFQSDEPMGCYDDFEAGHDFFLWGNNMAECHPVLFSRVLENRRKNPSVQIIDIATRWTQTSDFADMFVQIRPGTDLALANAILHLLVAKGHVNASFVEQHITFKRGIEDIEKIGYGCYDEQAERYTFKDEPRDSSLEELEQFLADYTPTKVSEITGVSPAQIEILAELYGNQRRNTVSVWCMGVNQHVRGTWMNNLITDLHLLTGKISRPGNNPFSLTGQPSACGTVREVGTLCDRLPADRTVTKPEHRAETEKLWNLPAGTIPDKPGYHTMDMFRALARGDVKVIWVQTTNPWVSLPNLTRFERKANDDRFIIVSDIYPTPSTAAADLILPSAAWVEREGVFGNTERRTQQWNKLVDPPGEAKEDAWQIVQVAKKMGYDKLFPWPEDDWHKPMFEEYRSFTVGIGKDLASYDQLQAERGLRWPVVNGRETRYRYAAPYDPYVKKPEGVHFYKAKGYGERAALWLRPHHPPAESPDEEYPFWLSTGRVLEHWHTGSMTRRVKQLHQAVPAAYVEIERTDADAIGVTSGDKVRVKSRRGELILAAVVDGRGRPAKGSVFVPFFDEAKQINLLTLDAMDSISKEPDYKKCAVRIEKA